MEITEITVFSKTSLSSVWFCLCNETPIHPIYLHRHISSSQRCFQIWPIKHKKNQWKRQLSSTCMLYGHKPTHHKWAQLFLFLRAQLTVTGVTLSSTKPPRQITLTEGTQVVPVPWHTDLLSLHQASPFPMRTSTPQKRQCSFRGKCWLNNCVQVS